MKASHHGKLRRAVTFAAIGGLLAVTTPATVATADPNSKFKDYYQSGVDTDEGASKPIHLQETSARSQIAQPLRIDNSQVTETKLNIHSLGSKLKFTSKAPAPRAQKSPVTPNGIAGSSNTTSFDSFFCAYRATSATATPPPPASGEKYGIAIASSSSLYGAAQAFNSQGGAFQSPSTSSANISMDLAIDIPFEWPQPSQINAYVNPKFKGGHYVDSRTSPITFSSSQASTRQLIQFGWSRDSTQFMQTLWDIQTLKKDGTSDLIHYYWDGLDDGYYYAFNIDSTPAHTYNFSSKTTTSATSDPVFGAGAAAQIDYGSLMLDAPSLGPDNIFQASIDRGYLVEYLLPVGWELANC